MYAAVKPGDTLNQPADFLVVAARSADERCVSRP